MTLAVFSSEGCRMCRALNRRSPRSEGIRLLRCSSSTRCATPTSGAASMFPEARMRWSSTGSERYGRKARSIPTVSSRRLLPRLPDAGVIGESLALSTSRRGFLARPSRLLALLAGGGAVAALVRPGEADASASVATSTRPIPARIRRDCPVSTPRASRFAPPTVTGSTTSGGRPTLRGSQSMRTVRRSWTQRACRCLRRRAVVSARTSSRRGSHGLRTSTVPGIAAAAAMCANSSTAARGPPRRINGDAALTGYCYAGRRVYCVMYYDTKIPC